MKIIFTPGAKEDVDFWKTSGNISIFNKIKQLLIAIRENPFKGVGKPERLKHNLSGYWSRRINQEHRLVYKVTEEAITVVWAKGHYD